MAFFNTKNIRFLLIAYLALIIIVSSIPGKNFPKSPLLSYDKLLHLFEYSVVGFLAINTLTQQRIKLILLTLLACAGFAALDELWQSMIPGRNADIMDFLADNIGVWIGAGFSIALNYLIGDD